MIPQAYITEWSNNVPWQTNEQVLQEVYDYLKSVQGKSEESVSLSQNLRIILAEDKALLERLAQ